MGFYPIIINLKERLAAVIGGGDVALRKIRDLIEAGARIRIISPEIHEEIDDIQTRFPDRIEIFKRKYQHGDLENAFLAFSATNNYDVNRLVLVEAEEKGIPLNAVDDPDNCTFIVPSSIRRGDLIVAVSTGGASPSMSAKLRRIIEKSIPENIETTLEALQAARTILKTDNEFKHLDSGKRGGIMKKIVEDDRYLSDLSGNYRSNKLKEFLLKFC
jgi:siroheme synthase-like protein